MSIVQDKEKNNAKSQQQFEKETQAWHDAIKSKTEAMTKSRSQAWLGNPKDVPGADVTEVKIDKKEKK